MPYIPIISNYKPFYIQSDTDATALDTATQWGMVAKTNPHPILPKAKSPYKTSWLDEDGDDEYDGQLFFEAQEIEVDFYLKTYASGDTSAVELLNSQLQSFFGKVTSSQFKIYDAYTGIGRQKVRYVDYSEKSFIARDDWARCIFTVKLKVNDPVTPMTLSGGSIVDIGYGEYIVGTEYTYTANGDVYMVRGL